MGHSVSLGDRCQTPPCSLHVVTETVKYIQSFDNGGGDVYDYDDDDDDKGDDDKRKARKKK